MPIFQFKCENCSAIFEHLINMTVSFSDVNCISCGAEKVLRVEKAYFYPNKIFCPHDKELDSEKLKVELSGIFVNNSRKCGGCGTDGAPGKCKPGGGACLPDGQGCGGSCSCKKAVAAARQQKIPQN